MKKLRWYINPDDLTPEERGDRIVELLAKAVFILAEEELRGIKVGLKDERNPKSIISSPCPAPLNLKKGPVPFGVKRMGLDRVASEGEMKWIRRIQDLNKAGLSTEKIAKRLNQEDQESRRVGRWTRTAVWRILKRISRKQVAMHPYFPRLE